MFKKILLSIFISLNAFAFSVTSLGVNDNQTLIFNVENSNFASKISLITHDRIITCDPEVSGAFEYLSTTQIAFYPNKPLFKGTNYTCGNANGKISFTTEPFDIENIRALDDKNFMLSLNDTVNLDELKLKLKLYTKEKLAKNSVAFKVKSLDSKNFLVTLDKTYPNLYLFLPQSLKSKANIALDKDFTQDISKQGVFFKDNPNAISLNDIKVVPYSFDDGELGFKIRLKEYILASKKFIQIPNITNFSLSNIKYVYDKNDPNFYYEFDVKSPQIKPNTEYEIKILPGFGDNYMLNRELKSFVVKTGDLKPFAKFSDELPYISKGSSIEFKSANLNSVKVVINQISEQNYRYFLNYNTDITKLTTEVASKNFTLDNKPNQITAHRLNFDFTGFKDGVYNISIFYKDDKNKIKQISKQAYFSDISAVSTLGDGGIFVFTTRLSTAKALPNTQVTIYNENNEIIANGFSDKLGVYELKSDDFLSKKPKSIFIKNGSEENFLLLNKSVNNDALLKEKLDDYEALTYLASDIIRPNETLEGIVILKDHAFKPLSDLPVKVKILDPLNKMIKNLSLKTDKFGSIKIQESMGELSGTYFIDVEFANKLLDRKSFSIENFIPQRVKNEILTTKDEFLESENINLSLISTYLFGAPASNLSGSLTLNLSAKELKLKNYENFSFINSTIDSKTILDSKYFDIVLNNDGKKDFIIDYKKQLPVSNAINASLNFSILDNTKTVSEYKNLTIYPYKTLTAIAADKDFVDSGKSVKFSVLSLDSLSKKKLNPKLNISIYSLSWNYVLDSHSYKEQKELNLLDSFELEKDSFEYKFSSGGDYVVVANDYLSGSSASFEVYVSDWGGYGTKSAKDIQKATITLDKTSYKAGDEVKVDVNSAIKQGVAIISLVDKKVLEYKIINFDNHKALASFFLPKEFEKGYVNATIFRQATPLATPLRTYANKAIKVDKSAHQLNLELTLPQKVKNNELANIKIKSQPNSLIALFIVDEGVLNIIKQKEIDAFKYFDIILPISVKNYDIFDSLSTFVSKAKALSFGGDALFAAARKKNENPVKAKDIKTFKISTYLTTDENGEVSFEFKTPNNFNSKVRVTAISLKDDKINSKNSYIDIKDDIVIKPGVVIYLNKNDKLNLPITLINTTDSNKTLNLTSRSSANLTLDLNQTSVVLPARQSALVNAAIFAKDIGEADFNLSVNDTKDSYLSTTNLDIISPYPSSQYSKNAFLKGFEDFNISDESYKTLYLSASSTPDVILKNISKKLIEYPYGCTEQIASRLLALENLYTTNDKEQKEVDEIVERGVTSLILRLKDNGSFGYWSKFSDTNIFASIYASDILLQIDKSKKLIGNASKELIYSYLKMPHQDPFNALYAAYVLGQNKALEKDRANYLFDSKAYEYNLVTLYMMAGILDDLGLENELNIVQNKINKYNLNLAKFDGYSANFDSTIRNLAFALYIHSKHFKPNKFSKKLAEMISKNFDLLNSTQKNAFVLRAFKSYFKEDFEKSEFEITQNGALTKYQNNQNLKLNLEKNKSFKLSSDDGIYYSLLSFGNEKLPLKHVMPELNDRYFNSAKSINIYREFVDINGKKVNLNDLKLNQTIFSKVQIYSNQNYMPNVLVNEQISPCFEVINERIYGAKRGKHTTDTITFENQDIKDERVVSFLNPLDKGKMQFFTPLKVVMSGTCVLPAVKVELMQDEDLWDYDLEMESFKVEK
ncbi:alpha-2-macroglobulin family protein [Campylobacter geochelonis]|uniref:alpha-2-macroglobulin family protein n=1 Tax=Campylobacter geochelonis TaxID=1780362 RepID=UPI0007708884|nr:hypothetical protein [Campylobacter geochelonis]CZE51464.1 alpha-2-macroglobulin family protein [Campylobacter geochelonis]